MSNIYDFTFPFSLIRKYISFTFKRYYGEFIVIGKENIPTDCPIIFAPNHTNALMDALAVHVIAPPKMSVIFLARADIFNNKKAAKALNFAKIMPAFRMRDGVENLGRNQEIFDKCVDVLHHNMALGIMPEGNQEIERKLRPLVKGIFRIAFAAQQKFGSQQKVKIVPIGLDFGNIIKAGKHIIITIGKPIEVSDYMAEYAINPVTATNEIRDCLKNALNNISLNLATDNYYSCFETATEVCNSTYLNKLKLPDKTEYRFVARQKIAKRLIDLEKNDIKEIQALDTLCSEYTKTLEKLNLRNWVFEQAPQQKRFKVTSDYLVLFWTFPWFMLGLMFNFIPFFLPVYLRKKVFKAQFTGFFSSLQYALGLITFPIFYLAQTIVFWSITDFPIWASILFLLLQYPFGKWALKWNSTFKKLNAKRRYNSYLKTRLGEIKQAEETRKQIIQIV